MITEDYVGYEVAKLLKEKGFPFMCNVGSLWVDKQGEIKFHNSYAPITWVNEDDPDTPCVTQALAMKWLREEHNLSIEISATKAVKGFRWGGYLHKIGPTDDFVEDYLGSYDIYEDAVEAALKYCLTYLI